MTKATLGVKGLFCLLEKTKARAGMQPRGRNWSRGEMYLLSWSAWLLQLEFVFKEGSHDRDYNFAVNCPLRSVINQENASDRCPQANLMKQFTQWDSFLWDICRFEASRQKLTSTHILVTYIHIWKIVMDISNSVS